MLRSPIIALVVTAVLLVSCGRTVGVDEFPATNRGEESVVAGSIHMRITSRGGAGSDASRRLFQVEFVRGLGLLSQKIRVELRPGAPEPFLFEAPAGQYSVNLRMNEYDWAPLRYRFHLAEQSVTYVGRLELFLPQYIQGGTRFRTRVVDTRSEDLDKLEERLQGIDYPQRDELMSRY